MTAEAQQPEHTPLPLSDEDATEAFFRKQIGRDIPGGMSLRLLFREMDRLRATITALKSERDAAQSCYEDEITKTERLEQVVARQVEHGKLQAAHIAALEQALTHLVERVHTDPGMGGPRFKSFWRHELGGRSVEQDYIAACDVLARQP